MSWFRNKTELDPTYTYVVLTELEVQEALSQFAYRKLGWKGGIRMDSVRFDFYTATATVGIKHLTKVAPLTDRIPNE